MARTSGKNRRRVGAGVWELLIFLTLLGAAFLVYRIFFMAKASPPAAAPVIVQNVPPPAPVVVVTPPPAPARKAQAVVVSVPPTSRPILMIAPPLPERTPEVKIVERDLRIALDAAIKSYDFITNEKKVCLARVHRSREYLDLKADADAKKSAKAAAAEKLRQDNASGADTEQDGRDLQTASTDWIAAAAKLTMAENDALAADSALVEKEGIFKSASADVTRLNAKLIADIGKAIDDAATDPDCTVGSIKLDLSSWSITTELAPKQQADTSAMADAAVTQIGNILENALCQSPFSWTKSKFTVFGTYHGKPAVEFQVRYDRRAVDNANFDRLHPKYFDDEAVINLGDRVWLSPVVDEIQGRTRAILAAVKEQMGNTEDYDTLLVGGYQRADGSRCPLVYINRPHVEAKSSSFVPIIPGHGSMPPSYSAAPMPGSVVDHLPDMMIPPD